MIDERMGMILAYMQFDLLLEFLRLFLQNLSEKRLESI